MMNKLLRVENLSVEISSPGGRVQAVRDISFEVNPDAEKVCFAKVL